MIHSLHRSAETPVASGFGKEEVMTLGSFAAGDAPSVRVAERHAVARIEMHSSNCSMPAWFTPRDLVATHRTTVRMTASPPARRTPNGISLTLRFVGRGVARAVVGVSDLVEGGTFMSTTAMSIERYQPFLTEVEQTTVLGFLAGYRGFTREAYALDLRQFCAWCWQHNQQLLEARRVDIECFARDLEDRGKASATVARRLCTVVGFYRYAEEEGVLEHSPAGHIRRPRLDYESHVAHLDRNDLGAILVAAGVSSPRDHALVSLLALNGLRVSEAIGANIDALGLERGHRTLTVVRKGGKVATMPLAPRVARAVDLAIGERLDGPLFIDADGRRLDRHAAGRIVRRVARRAGISKRVGPHTLRHAFITAALDAGVPLRDVQEAASHADPRTTMRYDRGRQRP
jgi:site-specific recombinase XerD